MGAELPRSHPCVDGFRCDPEESCGIRRAVGHVASQVLPYGCDEFSHASLLRDWLVAGDAECPFFVAPVERIFAWALCADAVDGGIDTLAWAAELNGVRPFVFYLSPPLHCK